MSRRTWLKWKEIYRAAAKKSKINLKAAGGKDQFGSANMTVEEASPPDGELGISVLNGYFDNLTAAATNEKAVLDKLVETNVSLAASTAELTEKVSNIAGENWTLQQEINGLWRKLGA